MNLPMMSLSVVDQQIHSSPSFFCALSAAILSSTSAMFASNLSSFSSSISSYSRSVKFFMGKKVVRDQDAFLFHWLTKSWPTAPAVPTTTVAGITFPTGPGFLFLAMVAVRYCGCGRHRERDVRKIKALAAPEQAPPMALALTFSDGVGWPWFGRASHLAPVRREVGVSL